MKKLIIIFAVGIFTACGSSTENGDDVKEEVTPKTAEKVKEAQDVNIKLEAIDGELDSLIITIK